MKSKLILLILALASAMLFSACRTSFTNLTPQRIPQNPSDIYTLSFAAKIGTADVIENSLKAYIVIDGETHPMERTSPRSRIFEYEYTLPPNRNAARYYFVLKYNANVDGSVREREQTSSLQTLSLTNRYVISMQAERGPVGAEIPVVGRGFSRFDKIHVGGYEAQTLFASPVALSFIVPPLPANEDYPVTLVTGSNELSVGTFRIDPSSIRLNPSALEMATGQKRFVLFSIRRPAPEGGLPIEITTDIPASVIIPLVRIPVGKQTISVPVEAGAAGEGTLYISAPGFEEVEIPVRITESGNSTAEASTSEPASGTTSRAAPSSPSVDAEALIIEE